MVYIYKTVRISNPRKPWLAPVRVKCHLDTRALMLSITERIAEKLEFPELEKRTVVMKDGAYEQVPYVGPVKIDFGNWSRFCCAFVLGLHPHLGAVHIDDTEFAVGNCDHKTTAVAEVRYAKIADAQYATV